MMVEPEYDCEDMHRAYDQRAMGCICRSVKTESLFQIISEDNGLVKLKRLYNPSYVFVPWERFEQEYYYVFDPTPAPRVEG